MLKNVDDNVEIDPEMVKIKVSVRTVEVGRRVGSFQVNRLTLYGRTGHCMPSTLSKMRGRSGRRSLRRSEISLPRARSSRSVNRSF